MPRKGKIKDPHAEREADRYENPIPSRELILQLLADASEPLNHNQIARELALSDHEQVDALRKRLRAMQRDGQIMATRKGAFALVDRLQLTRCRVQGHRDGYGFAIPHLPPAEVDVLLVRHKRDGKTVAIAMALHPAARIK